MPLYFLDRGCSIKYTFLLVVFKNVFNIVLQHSHQKKSNSRVFYGDFVIYAGETADILEISSFVQKVYIIGQLCCPAARVSEGKRWNCEDPA